jgi:glyoxylase-like metal-dependent hydrolase (beta-lactamase superfamily II)
MILEVRAVPPFGKNGFVVACPDTLEGVMIDPGDEVGELLQVVDDRGIRIKYILLTHAHLDHITGVDRAKARLDVPVGLHRADEFLYKAAVQQGLAFGYPVRPQPPIDFYFDDAGPWRFGRYGAWVHHTPGHCPGGVCLAVGREDDAARTLFVGDTLFAGSIGRTDLPGGDYDTLMRSIRDVLFAFPDDSVVWPGHGEQTTIGREKRTNPYAAGAGV